MRKRRPPSPFVMYFEYNRTIKQERKRLNRAEEVKT